MTRETFYFFFLLSDRISESAKKNRKTKKLYVLSNREVFFFDEARREDRDYCYWINLIRLFMTILFSTKNSFIRFCVCIMLCDNASRLLLNSFLKSSIWLVIISTCTFRNLFQTFCCFLKFLFHAFWASIIWSMIFIWFSNFCRMWAHFYCSIKFSVGRRNCEIVKNFRDFSIISIVCWPYVKLNFRNLRWVIRLDVCWYDCSK